MILSDTVHLTNGIQHDTVSIVFIKIISDPLFFKEKRQIRCTRIAALDCNFSCPNTCTSPYNAFCNQEYCINRISLLDNVAMLIVELWLDRVANLKQHLCTLSQAIIFYDFELLKKKKKKKKQIR